MTNKIMVEFSSLGFKKIVGFNIVVEMWLARSFLEFSAVFVLSTLAQNIRIRRAFQFGSVLMYNHYINLQATVRLWCENKVVRYVMHFLF